MIVIVGKVTFLSRILDCARTPALLNSERCFPPYYLFPSFLSSRSGRKGSGGPKPVFKGEKCFCNLWEERGGAENCQGSKT